MHTTSSNALNNINSCFVLGFSEVHMFSGQTPAASFTWRTRAIHSANKVSCRPFKFLVKEKRTRGLCLDRPVLGKKWWVGQGECFFFFIITTTTASFVPNIFFTTDYQELAPDSSKRTMMMMMIKIIIIIIRRRRRRRRVRTSCPK